MQPTELIPQCFRQGAERMASAFGELDQIIVAAHVNPDGDAAGAVAAACHVLRSMGKEIMAYAQPGLPGYLDFFPMPVVVHTTLEHPPFTPRCAVLLDCGEPDRLGRELAARLPGLVTVNIDHHLGGDGMGSAANWVEPRAAATAQLMAYVSLAAGLPLTGDLATAVALGIITDTGGFCHGNTSADVLYLTAHMVEHGCDIALLRERLENTWSRGRLTLWDSCCNVRALSAAAACAFAPCILKTCANAGPSRKTLKALWSSCAACAACMWRPCCARIRPAAASSACAHTARWMYARRRPAWAAADTATPQAARCARPWMLQACSCWTPLPPSWTTKAWPNQPDYRQLPA